MNEQQSTQQPIQESLKAKWLKHGERERLLIATGILILVSGVSLGYFVGHRQGMSVVGASGSDLDSLKEQVQQQQSSITTLTDTLSKTVQERDIALTTSKGLTDTLAQKTADQTLADSRLKAYRDRLLDFGGIALALQNVEIVPISQNVFEYHIDLMQLRQRTSAARGTLSVRLLQGDTVVTVPVSTNINLTDFQRITGRWTMPSGFTPEFVEISANAGGQSLVQRFAWERGAPMKNMPLTATPDARTAKVISTAS
jgi:hypothetical protein